ncbi:hypothetical protein GPJ56_005249 [Histomonas meleagridis]|uniref:uncharacterized protein n=1 Tax=Histomonas meleagridis TaxID=135588 RepID=UPI00355A520C|nr:hypothetical protein GPJ56_005249 [Histomonas meleagridis]KAH0802099.1 hypothetical protein GO595_005180 [Histomonas meleagridis]
METLCTLNGCHYNDVTKKCINVFSNYKSSGDKDSSIKPCFAKYTNAGDVICFSRKKGIKCGFCNTNKICVPGTSKGALDNLCSVENYTFGKALSNQIDLCSHITKPRHCRDQCQWDSEKEECQQKPIQILPELNVLLENSQGNSFVEEQDSNAKSSTGKYLIIGGIALLAVCVVVISVIVLRKSRNGKFFKMSSAINLDDLPSVN